MGVSDSVGWFFDTFVVSGVGNSYGITFELDDISDLGSSDVLFYRSNVVKKLG